MELPGLAQLKAPFQIDIPEDIYLYYILRKLKNEGGSVNMLSEKLLKIEKAINDIKSVQRNAKALIDERKLKFAMMGVNEAVKAIAEIMILEKFLDSLESQIGEDVTDDEEFSIISLQEIQELVPGAEEMLDYISLKYSNQISNECYILKSFIDQVQHQTVMLQLFKNREDRADG